MIVSLFIAAAIAQSTDSVAQTNLARSTTQFQVSAAFVNSKTGEWLSGDHPEFINIPTVEKLYRTAGKKLPSFGISFDCRVKSRGGLVDCKTLHASPKIPDGAELMRTIRSLLHLNKLSVPKNRSKDYRVAVMASLTVFNADGIPTQCNPPFCIADELQAPPSPPLPKGPVASAPIKMQYF